MRNHTMPPSSAPRWSTSSLGQPADISSAEYTALSEHLNLCTGLRNRSLIWRGRTDTMQAILAARVVTAAVVISLLVLAVWLVR